MEDGMRSSLRVGSVCAIFGATGYALFGVLHGSLSGRGGAEVLFRHVLERPYWDVIHLAGLLCILCWIAAFVTLTKFMEPDDPSSTVATFAVVGLIFGSAIAALQFLVDGFTLTALANEWASASPADRRDIVQTGDLLQTLIREPVFASETIFLFGLPFALMGFGIALYQRFPAWLGWFGIVVGGATFFMGVAWFVGVNIIPEVILWAAFQPLQWIWLITLGVFMWRRSTSVRERSRAVAVHRD